MNESIISVINGLINVINSQLNGSEKLSEIKEFKKSKKLSASDIVNKMMEGHPFKVHYTKLSGEVVERYGVIGKTLPFIEGNQEIDVDSLYNDSTGLLRYYDLTHDGWRSIYVQRIDWVILDGEKVVPVFPVDYDHKI